MESVFSGPHDATMTFAQQLTELRAAANFPSFRWLEERTGFSRSALNAAVLGRKVPMHDTAQALVESCGGNWAEWRPLWKAAMEQSASVKSARLAHTREHRRSLGPAGECLADQGGF